MTTILSPVAVIGSGLMGGGIAQVLALGGSPVRLADTDASRALAARERLARQAQAFERDGLFDEGAADRVAANLSAAASIAEAVEDARYITEAVPEEPAVKTEVLGTVCAAAPDDAVVATNTSAIPIGRLAAAVTGPERFLGVHWMNPAPFVPGVEVIATPDTREDVVADVEAMLRRVGKVPVRVADSPGFVANRLQFALYREAVRMVEEGLVEPAQLDLVVSNAFGFRLPFFGPFAIGDLAGLDVYAGAYASLSEEYGDRLAAPERLTALVDEGRLGVKSGGGFLDIPSSQTEALLAYRDRAYAALSRLRDELGPPPGLES